MKNIFITGSTGLLGTNLANTLLDLGYSITALVRDPSRYHGKQSPKLRLIQMGLFDAYDSYLEGVDIVVHIAADISTNGVDYAKYEQTNDVASTRLFKKAQANKVASFIFISTSNTIGYGSLKEPGKEGNPMRKPFSKHFYAQSKASAEQNLLKLSKETRLIILNPTFMIGAEDSKPSSGKLLLTGLNKKIIFYPPGGKNFVPVIDVVQAIISSFSNGCSGEKYLIAGENFSYKTFYQKMLKLNHQKAVLIPVPTFLFLLVGLFGEVLRFFKVKTSLSYYNLKSLCVNNYYTNEKSVKDLKLTYSSIEDAIESSLNYFKAKNN